MNHKILSEISFFHNKPTAFLAALLPLLKPIKIDKNQIIYLKGDPAHEG